MRLAHIISEKLRFLLARQGRLVALHPLAFLLVPLILSTLLSYGFMFMPRLTARNNVLALYFPQRGLSESGKTRILEAFGSTFQSELNPINGFTFTAQLTANGSDILNRDFAVEYLWLRSLLEGLRVYANDGWQTYSELCYRDPNTGTGCIPDFVQVLTKRGIFGFDDVRLMTFPETALPSGTGSIRIKVPLGGVSTNRGGYIRAARGALMNFHFPYRNMNGVRQWEREFRRVLNEWQHRSPVQVSWFTMGQFQDDLDRTSNDLHSLMPCLLFVIIVFCMSSCCVADWVHSKPLLAFGGVVTALVSCISGFGILLLCQVQMVDIVYVAPFLILSIGVDDMFLLLAAWRKTNTHSTVEDRLGRTFAEAAVSISITSLTDILSFLIGAASVFPAVQFFCLYTAVCLAFNYCYQITFFGAILAYSGRREAANRHCFFFFKLQNSAQSRKEGRGLWHRVLCTGGDGREDAIEGTLNSSNGTDSHEPITCEISAKENLFNSFFQRYYAPLLTLRPVQIGIGISYICYLAGAIYGTTTVQVGMNYAELLPDETASSRYFLDARKYFLHYTPPLEILLPSNARWEKKSFQRRTLALARALENTEFTGPAEFWLRDFIPFAASRPQTQATRSQSEASYFGDLRAFYEQVNDFLADPSFSHYRRHLRFDRLSGQIKESRMLVSVKEVDYGRERAFLSMVKDALEDSDLNATGHHASFQLGEQQAAVLPSTLQTVGVATGAMLIISFALIPKPACSLCLAACIVSTNLGVLGYMALWGVRLDIISSITVLMSIGISVDFVAHISYFYVQALEMDLPVSKAERALQYLGLPILQGAMSTVCGMLVLLAIQAYMIRAFVKTLLLVILFGLYHGLVLLPVVLSLFIRDKERKRLNQESATSSESASKTPPSSGKHKSTPPPVKPKPKLPPPTAVPVQPRKETRNGPGTVTTMLSDKSSIALHSSALSHVKSGEPPMSSPIQNLNPSATTPREVLIFPTRTDHQNLTDRPGDLVASISYLPESSVLNHLRERQFVRRSPRDLSETSPSGPIPLPIVNPTASSPSSKYYFEDPCREENSRSEQSIAREIHHQKSISKQQNSVLQRREGSQSKNSFRPFGGSNSKLKPPNRDFEESKVSACHSPWVTNNSRLRYGPSMEQRRSARVLNWLLQHPPTEQKELGASNGGFIDEQNSEGVSMH